MTQQNCRGAYYRPEHDRKEDWDWLAKWQPNVIRLMINGKAESPNSVSIDQIQRVHDTCPQATILLRVWEIDDNNFHAHEAMVANPTAEAEKQLNWWAGLFDRLSSIPRNLLMAGLNNETGPDKDASLYPYTERALQIGTVRAIRLGVFVFSVGRPSLPDEAEWTIDSFARLDNAILANHGAIILHEYFQPEGMYAVWTDDQGHERKDYTYLVGRHMRWNVKSPIIIAEWGLNGLLYNRHPDPQWGDSGWLNFKKDWPPSRYADEYVECVRQASPNVIGICPYISDWSDHHWQSFDLIEAYGEFLARKDLCVKEISGTPPTPTPTPPTTTTMYVAVPSGARIRSAPVIRTDNILTAVPYGEPVIVTNYTADHSWAEVGYQDIRGWMSSALMSSVKPPVIPTTPPVPTPTPPTGDKWTRTINWVLQWEGGYQNSVADKGNWTGCAQGKGENKGTNFGISACSYPNLDIKNLTKQQAIDIYARDYWVPSGASELPWPYCLLVMDTAVLHGIGAAKGWLATAGPDPYTFAAKRLHTYTALSNWEIYGKGWVNRTADLLEEMGA